MAQSDEHLKPLRLFDIARNSGSEITEQEEHHLRDCEECKRIVKVFARQFGKPPDQKPGDAA
jgi:hypothetical protein